MDHEHPPRTEEHPVSDDIPSILKDAEAKMKKSVEVTKDEFTAIRTGRANAAMLQGITVEYYGARSEEHTSELQSRGHLVCRLLLEKKNTTPVGPARRENGEERNPGRSGSFQTRPAGASAARS